jgi:uncharacterized protein DUF4333
MKIGKAHLGWMVGAVLLCGLGPAIPSRADELDMEAVKKSIRDGLVKQLEVTVQQITCPKTREAEEGDVFDCTAQVEEVGVLTVTVTQKDDDANIGWNVTKTEGLLDLKALESQIRAGLEAHGGVDVKVNCGGRFRGIRVGQTFECHAIDKDGETPTIRVTMKDAEGNVNWKVVEAP